MLSLLLSLVAATPQPQIILSTRIILPIVIYAPSPDPGPVTSQQAISAIQALLSAEAFVQPVELDDGVVEECRGSISCVLRSPAFQVACRGDQDMREPGLVLWIEKLSTNSVSRFGLALVDLKASREILATGPGDRDSDILSHALRARVQRTEVRDSGGLTALIGGFVEEHLRPNLESAGAWGLRGTLVVGELPVPARILIDGSDFGLIPPEGAALVGAPSGPREIRLVAADFVPTTTTVQIPVGGEVELRPEFVHVPTSGATVRKVVRLGALVAVGLGAASTLYGGIAAGEAGTNKLCLSTEFDGCRRWVRIGGDLGGHGGLPAVPVGAAVLATGVTWLVGSLLEGDEWDAPWWSVAVGTALGAITMTAMLAAE